MKFKLEKRKNRGNFSFLNLMNYYKIYLISIFLTSCLILGFFLYNNFYLTITGSEEIIILSSEVTSENLSTKEFDEAIKKIKNKKEFSDLNLPKIINPF